MAAAARRSGAGMSPAVFSFSVLLGLASLFGLGSPKTASGNILEKLMEAPDAGRLKNASRYMSEQPKVTGSRREKEIAAWMMEQWRPNVDSVEEMPYLFYLSFPNKYKPNKVRIFDTVTNETVFVSKHVEEGMEERGVVPAYLTHSKTGKQVRSQIFFANYGTESDLKLLEKQGANLRDQFVLVKYGSVLRSAKITNMERRGVAGVLLYVDPTEAVGTEDEVRKRPFHLKSDGMQRGWINYAKFLDEPLSPGWPSLVHAYRLAPRRSKFLEQQPNVMVQPIGYGDAAEIMKRMGGSEVPEEWRGDLNATYRFGGALRPRSSKISFEVNNVNLDVRSSNIIATIRGSQEPDRYVIIGNHRDAWTFGGVDSTTGGAALTEVVRVFGQVMRETGWRPRRTIVFASWTAEEQGMLGSSEFVQHKLEKLRKRAVAYFNVDTCGGGLAMLPFATPSLRRFVLDVMRANPSPDKRFTNYWDFLADLRQYEPFILTLGSDTDDVPFNGLAGVSAINFFFTANWFKYPREQKLRAFAQYHTAYDQHDIIDKIDPDMVMHKTCTQMASRMIHVMAEAKFLPHEVKPAGPMMSEALEKFQQRIAKYPSIFEQNGVTLRHLNTSVAAYIKAANGFDARLQKMIKNPEQYTDLDIRIVNDQLMQTDRYFTSPEGIPTNDMYNVKNIVFWFNIESQRDLPEWGQADGVFPGLNDFLQQIIDSLLAGQSVQVDVFEAMKKHISDIAIVVQNAADSLAPSHII